MKWRRAFVLASVIGLLVTASAPASAWYVSPTGPPWQVWDYGPSGTKWQVDYQWTDGSDATCGPSLPTGDGWQCQPHTPNKIQFTGAASRDTGSSRIENIGVDIDRSSTNNPATASYRDGVYEDCSANPSASWCGYPGGWNNSGYSNTSNWRVYNDVEGGYWFGYAVYNYKYWNGSGYTSGIYNTGEIGLDPTITGLHLDPIETNPINQPPTSAIGAPNGTTLQRTSPADVVQVFSMSAADPEGHNWTGRLEVTAPGASTPFFTSTFNGLSQRSGLTQWAAPVALPHVNGTYTIRARATDTSGTSTAVGPWRTASFTYNWNTAPTVPQRVDPVPQTVVAGNSAVIATTATDGESDVWSANVVVRNAQDNIVADTSGTLAASGAPSTTVVPALSPGSYTWTARAIDQQGWASNFTGARSFVITDASANQPPAAPVMNSPAAGATFAAGAPQVFRITATDPNGDDYVGLVQIQDLDGHPLMQLATSPAPSGQPAAVSPPVPLPAGTYTWTAAAVDARGGLSGTSGPRAFFVAGSGPLGASSAAPAASSPLAGATFAAGERQAFSVVASTPGARPYTALITVTDAAGRARGFTTAGVASGAPASVVASPALPAGSYSWRAVLVDAAGHAVSSASPARRFTVAANRVPLAPRLVGVASGQRFEVVADDPDGHVVTATVTVRNARTGAVVATITTPEAPSDFATSAAPGVMLRPGRYVWTARARDVLGAVGPESAPSVTVVRGRSRS